MLGSWQLEFSLQVTLVVMPLAVYFLVLGLLNSQRRPQLLSGRVDFALLMASLSPLAAVPLLGWLGANWWMLVIVILVIAGAIAALAPRRHEAWVIYNISMDKALRAAEAACAQAGLPCRRQANQLTLEGGACLKLSSFPLLRIVSLTLTEGRRVDRAALGVFEQALAERLGGIETIASPLAVSFVLGSTAMIVAPLVLLGDRMPEMVRLLTDFVR